MKAIDKLTRRIHSYCPIINGYQVCVYPDMEWEATTYRDVCVISCEQFHERYKVVD